MSSPNPTTPQKTQTPKAQSSQQKPTAQKTTTTTPKQTKPKAEKKPKTEKKGTEKGTEKKRKEKSKKEVEKEKKKKLNRSNRKGITLKDVSSKHFIKAYSSYLKRTGKVNVPKWSNIVKTGIHKQLAPYNPDWFYVRMAAIARRIYLRPCEGIGFYKRIFGGSYSNGLRPYHFTTSSGSIIRTCLKQLTALKVIEPHPKGGRRVTSSGRRDLDRISAKVALQLGNKRLQIF